MKSIKKTLSVKAIAALLLVLSFALTLCACAAKDGSEGVNDNPNAPYYEGTNNSPADALAAAEKAAQEALNAVGGIDEVGKPAAPDKTLIENEFIKVARTPVSTFSADVDTASYTYFRKLINSGYDLNELINYAGGAIRTEEMINYFTYDYSAPAQNELFGVNAGIIPCPWNTEAALLCLGLKTEAKIKSNGNNLVFLIDVSGSMKSSDKLELLKTSFGYLTGQLTASDTISIVTYSGNESVVLEGCKGSKSEEILKAIKSLEAGGSTNGQAGLTRAYSIAKQYFIEGGNNRIIMASDGDLNVGISSPEELKSYVEEKRGEGIYLSVLGFGTGNYRDSNMEALADNGNGVYYYIDGAAEAEKVFGNDILSTLYTVAEDVKLQLTFDPACIEAYRLVGYENRLLAKEDFEDDTKDAGEVGAGHSVTVCYELILTDAAKAQTKDTSHPGDKWLGLAVRYKEPGESVSKLNEYSLGCELYTGTPSDDLRFICTVIETSMLLHKSEYIGDIKLNDILGELDRLTLTDSYKLEFRDMIRFLAKQ